jgi:hypothetical protein
LIFENDETSKSFVIPIIDDGSIFYVRDPGRIGAGNPNFLRDFTITLTDVQLDPLEDPTVLSPPRFEASHSATWAKSRDMDMTPFGVLFGAT